MKDDAERAREAICEDVWQSIPAYLHKSIVNGMLAFAQQPEGWRTIETAPKDGTKFDAWAPSRFGGYRMADLSFGPRGKLRQHGELTAAELPRWPTHWMPRPAPP